MSANQTNKGLLFVLLVVVLGAIGWAVLTLPDQRTAGQKIGDAVEALPQGVDKAAEQFEDRTPGEKLGDAVKDVGDDIKSGTDN